MSVDGDDGDGENGNGDDEDDYYDEEQDGTYYFYNEYCFALNCDLYSDYVLLN